MLLGVDVGGTFTDAVVVADDGTSYSAKAPSTPGAQHEGVLAAVAAVLEKAGAEPRAIGRFAHGMTVATNALLEGVGAKTALIATDGFTDIVELGRQARPSLYKLCEAAPEPLVPLELRFGASERTGPDGRSCRLTKRRPWQCWSAWRTPNRKQLRWRCCTHTHIRLTSGASASCSPSSCRSACVAVARVGGHLPGVRRRAASTEVDAALSPLLSDLSGASGMRATARDCPRPR